MKFALLCLIAALACADDAKNPIPFTSKSISQGKATFARMCTGCHGVDAKAGKDDVPEASDLTDPKGYKNGTTEGEMFRSIRDGQGTSMPSFKADLKPDDEIWHLVNFVRNLWPAK